MFTIKTPLRELGPYIATYSGAGQEGPIESILYDTGIFDFAGSTNNWAIGLRMTTSIFGKNILSIDVINLSNGEFFPVQLSNLYYFRDHGEGPVIIIRIENELRLYRNFGKTSVELESDGDKVELTPLGFGSCYVEIVRENNEFYGYRPIILDPILRNISKVSIFWDYYGFKSYTDSSGIPHFVLFIEDEESTEAVPAWYWVDNFVRISERIDLASDQYVEEWELDPYAAINFTTTNGRKYSIDRGTGKMKEGFSENTSKSFAYTRVDEDTDSKYIVAQNTNGVFVISSDLTKISDSDIRNLKYYKSHIFTIKPRFVTLEGTVKDKQVPRFLLEDISGQIVLVDEHGDVAGGTDLTPEEVLVSATINKSILEARLADGSTRKYLLS